MKKIIYILFVFLILSLIGCEESKNNSLKNETNNQIIDSKIIRTNFYNDINHLDLSNKEFKNMPNICSALTGDIVFDIKSIDLSQNQISDVNIDYSCLINLEELNLAYNKIDKFIDLGKLNNLKHLKLHKNKLSKIDLSKYLGLTKLNLGYNKFSNTNDVLKLTNLTGLQLQHNNITSLSGLSNLNLLETLKLEYNNISDKNQLENIINLKELNYLNVSNNKLSNKITNKINNWTKSQTN